MNCYDEKKLRAYLQNELSEVETIGIDRHLGECDACALQYAELCESLFPVKALPEGFVEATMKRLPPLLPVRTAPRLDVLKFAAAAVIAVIFWQIGFFSFFAEMPIKAEQVTSSVQLSMEQQAIKRQYAAPESLKERVENLFSFLPRHE